VKRLSKRLRYFAPISQF